jgi:Fur family ferric uptake transcriptional regulator
MHQSEEFRRSLRQRGYRITPQREMILAAVRAGDGHSTAEDVFVRVATLAPSMSRATVYRTLDFLEREHLITSADLGEGRRVFESAEAGSHHHLVCTRCRSVRQIEHAYVARMFAEFEREFGFVAEAAHLGFFGLCGQCRFTDQLDQPDAGSARTND